MMEGGLPALAGLGIALGLCHGVDWDHIAVIADITSASVPTANGAPSGRERDLDGAPIGPRSAAI